MLSIDSKLSSDQKKNMLKENQAKLGCILYRLFHQLEDMLSTSAQLESVSEESESVLAGSVKLSRYLEIFSIFCKNSASPIFWNTLVIMYHLRYNVVIFCTL